MAIKMTIDQEGPFMDIREHGFFRVAAVVPKVSLANPLENAKNHVAEISAAYRKGACYIVCPELGLTGYSNQDLFFDLTLQDSAVQALKMILTATAKAKVVITLGLPLVFNQRLFNCAVTIYKGKILAIVPKMYPPNYREFYEGRHFAQGSAAWFTSVDLLGQKDIPFGSNLLLKSNSVKDFVLHTQVCEDGWVPVPPSALAVLAGATVVANVSASNVTIDKNHYREALFGTDSGRWNCTYIYCAAGFGESTSDLAWDGDAFIAERGMMLTRTQPFNMNSSHIITDVDLQLASTERQRQTSWHQNGADFMEHMKAMQVVEFDGELGINSKVFKTFLRDITPHPFVPEGQEHRNERCEQVFSMQASSLARRLSVFPDDSKQIIIGVSGGQDSTQALHIAVRAMDLLKLPRTNVIALTMPGFGTTDRTKDNAVGLMQALGVTWKEISILPNAKKLLAQVKHKLEIEDATFENVQAWSRKFLELAMASQKKGMVLGTGDLSELALGWCTMFGDHASHYGVNAGIPKTLMTYLINWSIDGIFGDEPEVQTFLRDIVNTPISPELKSPDASGNIQQKTEDELGPYELYDFYMYYFVRFGFSPKKIARMAIHAFDGIENRDLAVVRKFLRKFITRFFIHQYKRNCLPDGVKIGLVCLSPRGDWRMPSDASSKIWLDQIDEYVPEKLTT